MQLTLRVERKERFYFSCLSLTCFHFILYSLNTKTITNSCPLEFCVSYVSHIVAIQNGKKKSYLNLIVQMKLVVCSSVNWDIVVNMRDVFSRNLHSVWGNNKKIDNIISRSNYCYKENKTVQRDRVTGTGMTITEGGENRKPLSEEMIEIRPKFWTRRFEAEYSR